MRYSNYIVTHKCETTDNFVSLKITLSNCPQGMQCHIWSFHFHSLHSFLLSASYCWLTVILMCVFCSCAKYECVAWERLSLWVVNACEAKFLLGHWCCIASCPLRIKKKNVLQYLWTSAMNIQITIIMMLRHSKLPSHSAVNGMIDVARKRQLLNAKGTQSLWL